MPLTHSSHPASSHLWVSTGWPGILRRVRCHQRKKDRHDALPMPIPATAQHHCQCPSATFPNWDTPNPKCCIITWWLTNACGPTTAVTAWLLIPTLANSRATECPAACRGYLLWGNAFEMLFLHRNMKTASHGTGATQFQAKFLWGSYTPLRQY